MKFYVSMRTPHHWYRATNRGKVKQQGMADALADVPVRKSDQVIVVLPGEDVITTVVDIPTRSRSKLIQAIPFALEDQLAEEVEEFFFILLNWKPGKRATVAVVSRQWIRTLKQQLMEAGIRPTALLADYQMLPVHPRSSLTIAQHVDGRISVMRDDGTGATMESDTLELWWSGMPDGNVAAAVNNNQLAQRLVTGGQGQVKEWNLGLNPPDWLKHHRPNHPWPNLLPGTFETTEKSKTSPALVMAGVLFAVAIAGKLGIDHYEYFILKQESRRLQSEINTLFTSTFPEERRVVNAKSQFRQKLKGLASNDSGAEFQQFLFIITQSVLATRSVVEEISYRENSMVVLCSVDNFSGLDALQKKLESFPDLQVQLVSSGSLGNRVTGRFKINRLGT